MKITLKNLTKRFEEGNDFAVKDVNLTIEDGELVSFLGPSGCGKTTILKMIAGLIDQTEGTILFDDKDIGKIPVDKRNIGMVFQNYALYPHMTAFDNIAFPLKIKKRPKAEIKERVNKIANFLEVQNLLTKKPGALSGGEQQRVAIGRALIKNPDVLLMDEPLSNLDKKLRVQTREEIKRIQKELGITTIFVTHDQEEASAISDKILLLKKGEVQQFGSPNEIYREPVNLFAAKFIGMIEINIFEACIENKILKIKDLDCNIPIGSEVEDLKNIFIAIRPEDIRINNEKPDFYASISLKENMGKDEILTCLCTNKEFKLYVSPELNLHTGNKIGLEFLKNKILIFNESGNRMALNYRTES